MSQRASIFVGVLVCFNTFSSSQRNRASTSWSSSSTRYPPEPIKAVPGWGQVATPSQSEISSSNNQLQTWALNATSYGGPSVATNMHGVPVPSLEASQSVGTHGSVLLQDYFLVDKLASFNRQRVPPRVVHAKGAGAHGYFEVTHDMSKYTKAKFLDGVGKRTRTFARFSTTGGDHGSADSSVDFKGFSIKFYTEDGNYDWLGLNTEVFPVRDAMRFPDLNMSRRKNPQTGAFDPNMWWDFVSLLPETTYNLLQMFSDIGRPDGYRRMNGHGISVLKFVNSSDQFVYGRLHIISNQPSKALTFQESAQLAGAKPDAFIQDLYDSIAKGDFPSWTFYVQIMTVEQFEQFPGSPINPLRTWDRELYPWLPIGKLVLDRNPSNYFAEVEQVTYSPASLVPGIQPGPGRLLSGRLFAYDDAQRYRSGVNSAQIPINKPISEVHSYQRDGVLCHGDNGGGAPNYFPNSFGGAEADTVYGRQLTFPINGVVERVIARESGDLFEEARHFVQNRMDREERQRMIDAIADFIKDASEEIRERTLVNNFYPISRQFGDQIRAAINKAIGTLKSSAIRWPMKG